MQLHPESDKTHTEKAKRASYGGQELLSSVFWELPIVGFRLWLVPEATVQIAQQQFMGG